MKIGATPVRLTNDTDRDGNVQWTADGHGGLLLVGEGQRRRARGRQDRRRHQGAHPARRDPRQVDGLAEALADRRPHRLHHALGSARDLDHRRRHVVGDHPAGRQPGEHAAMDDRRQPHPAGRQRAHQQPLPRGLQQAARDRHRRPRPEPSTPSARAPRQVSDREEGAAVLFARRQDRRLRHGLGAAHDSGQRQTARRPARPRRSRPRSPTCPRGPATRRRSSTSRPTSCAWSTPTARAPRTCR